LGSGTIPPEGRVTVRVPESSEAETCFRRAIEIGGRQGAGSLELRAATSLAYLLHKQGEKEEARRMLGEVYGWFTEGSTRRI
jgi:adenylate cyclase